MVMLALHGFDAYGLEISQTAVAEAEKYASSELKEPTEHNFGSGNRSEKPGMVTFVEGDFFADDWERQCSDGEKFDLVYDYTVSFFLCILISKSEYFSFSVLFIHPSVGIGRREWRPFSKKEVCLSALSFPCIKTLNSRVHLGA